MMSWLMLSLASAMSRMISIHSDSASLFRGTRPELASTVQSARPRPEYEIGLEEAGGGREGHQMCAALG
jgi:hypothetical protein